MSNHPTVTRLSILAFRAPSAPLPRPEALPRKEDVRPEPGSFDGDEMRAALDAVPVHRRDELVNDILTLARLYAEEG